MSVLISDNADAVLLVARSIAVSLSHEYVGTEHVLMSLILTDIEGFGEWLTGHGITQDAFAKQLSPNPRPDPRKMYGLPLSPALTRVLSDTLTESTIPGEPNITVRTLIRALLRTHVNTKPVGGFGRPLASSEMIHKMLDELEVIEQGAVSEYIRRINMVEE